MMGCCGMCLLLMIIPMSIGTLLPLQYGLTVNWVTRQVGDEVYRGGRHFIGPWNSFIAFPSTVVTVTFESGYGGRGALATRTKDGLSLTLHLSFQYKVMPSKLNALYKLANLQYEPLVIRNARDVLLKAAAEYDAPQYWQERAKIGMEMKVLLNTRLNSVFTSCNGLQLLVIELPDEFETQIVSTQVQKQMVKTKQNDQHARQIEADTTVWKASYSRNVTVTKSGADADYIQEIKIAEAQATQRMLEVEARALKQVQSTLGLTSDQLVAYQQFVAYHAMTNASFIYGMGGAMLTLPAGV